MKLFTNSLIYKWNLIISFLLLLTSMAFAQEDSTHYSEVFGRDKPYRIFLPEDYDTSQKSYPVIYYFHGNNGTHELNLPGVVEMVEKNGVILVAWNGRNEDSNKRPYNIGNHSNINYEEQFKDYFLELVNHIDVQYRTLTDRSNRAVIGHSMGGIMSFYLAAKYPDMIGTAANSKGSPEFFMGYPHNHSLYSVRYFFKYMNGQNLRFHNSTNGELVFLNNEVHEGALREEGLNYEYEIYEGGHKLKPQGFEDMFNFTITSFKSPSKKPTRWNHTDFYPEFKVWGYEVTSNLDEPGFIDLKGVTNTGLRVSTKKWQPYGRSIKGVKIQIETAEIYKPNTSYTLFDYNETQGTKKVSKVNSDNTGRIGFDLNHESHQIGIFKKNDPGEIVYVAHEVNEKDFFLDHNKASDLKLQLLNRGGSSIHNLTVSISTNEGGVEIANQSIKIKEIKSGEIVWLPNDFVVTAKNLPVEDGSPFRIRFNLTFKDGKNQMWKDEFDAPVFYDVQEFTNIGIDDGDTEIFGSGNGNNIAEPGETVMFYEITGMSKRLRVFYDDPYLDEVLYDEIQPDKWGDGYTLSSLIRVADNCPVGRKIRFLAKYEVKEWKAIKRNVTWGTFSITIGEK